MEVRHSAEKGQIMKQQTSSYQFLLIEERRVDHSVYSLLRLEHGTLVKYAVCIEDRAGIEIAWIGEKEELCRALFSQIVAGSLSSVHLSDIAADFSRDWSLEIF